MTHTTSPVPCRRSSRKVKPNLDPDFEYVLIDQLDRELTGLGMSPRVTSPNLAGPLSSGSVPAPATKLTANSMADEIKLVELQRDKLALELEVLKLHKAASEKNVAHKVKEGADPSKLCSTRKKCTIDWTHEFCAGAPITEFKKLELPDFVAGFFAMIKP